MYVEGIIEQREKIKKRAPSTRRRVDEFSYYCFDFAKRQKGDEGRRQRRRNACLFMFEYSLAKLEPSQQSVNQL